VQKKNCLASLIIKYLKKKHKNETSKTLLKL
jgi:hypothetical protein